MVFLTALIVPEVNICLDVSSLVRVEPLQLMSILAQAIGAGELLRFNFSHPPWPWIGVREPNLTLTDQRGKVFGLDVAKRKVPFGKGRYATLLSCFTTPAFQVFRGRSWKEEVGL